MSEKPAEKKEEVYRVAHQLFTQDPDWVTFFREVLGLEGIVRQAFPQPDQMAEFERTQEYDQIQSMLAKLRDRGRTRPTPQEPTTVITVRLPKSLHDALRAEAHERRTSMNKLCIAKLLQRLDETHLDHFQRVGSDELGEPIEDPVNELQPAFPQRTAVAG